MGNESFVTLDLAPADKVFEYRIAGVVTAVHDIRVKASHFRIKREKVGASVLVCGDDYNPMPAFGQSVGFGYNNAFHPTGIASAMEAIDNLHARLLLRKYSDMRYIK